MTEIPNLITDEFRALSAELGQDPLQVQGPGGNTSIKDGGVMWIKASGTELADAMTTNIFVAVDRVAAVEEAHERAGDGSCKSTILDPEVALRPSIETTFHAALDHKVVVHTHSVATLTHAISPEGRRAAAEKLSGLPFVMVPYAKPGLPLTKEILARINPGTQIVILENHGLLCAGGSVSEVRSLVAEVEKRLALPARSTDSALTTKSPNLEFDWSDYGWIAQDPKTFELVRSGTYYPDHVVFLGPALPLRDHDGKPPVVLQEGEGVLIRADATPSQRAMLRCVSDVFARLPADWGVEAIGKDAEAELLNWDAEKYRQALAARG